MITSAEACELLSLGLKATQKEVRAAYRRADSFYTGVWGPPPPKEPEGGDD
jgi:hypothetical protein